MDELDNILNDENPEETEDVEQKEKLDSEEKESDSNKLEVEDQENENSSDRQVDDDAQVPQEDEQQETDKKEEDDEAQNAQDDEEKEEASEGETKKERRKRKKDKKSKRDKKDKKDKKRKRKSKDDEKSKIFGDSDEESESKEKDADFDTADVDNEEEEGKRALEEIVEKKKEKKKKRSRDDKKKSRSSKKKKHEDEDPDAVPEQQEYQPPSNEPNDFDLVIESLKKGHRRRKSDGPPEGSEDFVRNFIAQMDIAADNDVRANMQHLPALHKVKLLPEVAEQLAKKFLHDLFVSSGVLTVLKKWLDPLPDGSLPNIKVRETVLRGLVDMGNHVQTDDLRESGVGKAIMLLSKHPQETVANKKSAKTLIELWSRPIFNLSSKYKDMHKAEERYPVAEGEGNASTPAKSVKAVGTDLEHTPSGSPSSKSSKDNPSLHAKIPEKIALDFKVMPRANEEAARLLGMPKRGGDAKGLGRKSPGNNKKVERAVVMSIEGRGVYH